MAELVSAGTFVCAVMELAGYQAQSKYLDDFQDFFREGGAFIYTLAAVGAVASFLLFGSFRAARYLLVGPAIFWFLVGPRFTYDGVVWQIGGGTARGINQLRGEGQSLSDIRAVLERAGLAGDGFNGSVQVAKGFALFAKTINDITRGLVDLVLQQEEDGEYLRHLSRARAFEYAMAAVPQDPQLIEMLEGNVVVGCAELFQVTVALSTERLRPQSVRGSGPMMNAHIIAYYEGRIAALSTASFVTPNPAARNYMQAVWNLRADDPRLQRVSCGDMWRLTANRVEEHAARYVVEVLRLARGDAPPDRVAEIEETACQQLVAQFTSAAGNCRTTLQRLIAAYITKNAVRDRRSTARFLQRLLNERVMQAGMPSGAHVPLEAPPEGYRWGRQVSAPQLRTIGTLGQMLSNIGRHLVGDSTAAPVVGHFAEFELIRRPGARGDGAVATTRWTPVAATTTIGGPLDASLDELPRYNLKLLRQTLFSWSLHVPYWQGVILFFLASIYPFAALVVLIPGRATSFLNLPLAWLWIKSWDIGIASVMVFDRILWNIRPHVNVPASLVTGPLYNRNLYEVVAEAGRADQNWGLNMHYVVLALATLSIPAVTGYATLRARRAMLASFTDKIGVDAKLAGQMLANAYSIGVMQNRVQAMREFAALGARMMTMQGVGHDGSLTKGTGIEGNGRGTRAGFFAALAGMSKGIDKGAFSPNGVITGASQGAETAMRTMGTMVQLEHLHDRAHRLAFDPHFGRWSEIRMRMQAWAAAADKSEGFEIDDPGVSAHDELISLFSKKLETITDVAINRATGNHVFAGATAVTAHDSVQKALGNLFELMTPKADGDKEVSREELGKAIPALKGAVGWVFGDKVGEAFNKSSGDFLSEFLHLTPEATRRMYKETPFDFQPAVPLGADGKVLGEREKLFTFWTVESASPRPYSRFVISNHFQGPAPFFWQMGDARGPEQSASLSSKDFEGLQFGLQSYFKEELSARQSKKLTELQKSGVKDAKGRDALNSFLGVTESSEALVQYLRSRGEGYTLTHFGADKKAGELYESYKAESAAYWGMRKEAGGVRTQAEFLALAQQEWKLPDTPVKIDKGVPVETYVDQELKRALPAVQGVVKLVPSPLTDAEREGALKEIEKEAAPFISGQIYTRVAMRQFFDAQHRPTSINRTDSRGRPTGGFEGLGFHAPLGGAK